MSFLSFFANPVVLSVIAALFLLIVLWRAIQWLLGIIIVPDDSIGTVTKKFVLFGANRNLPDGQIVALKGEAGFQADTLSPGMHTGYWPWQYTVEIVKFTEIPQGSIGVVQACDGRPLSGGRVIARDIDCNFFQDARAFLSNDGERGPQMKVIPPGTYRINPLLFTVTLANATEIPQGKLGVVEEGALARPPRREQGRGRRALRHVRDDPPGGPARPPPLRLLRHIG